MNLTISLDDDLVAAAKSLATQNGTSVTALVRTALEQQVALNGKANSSASAGALKTLSDYSMGQIPRSVAMGALGFTSFLQLLHAVNLAGLPRPVVNLTTRRAMSRKMVELFSRRAK